MRAKRRCARRLTGAALHQSTPSGRAIMSLATSHLLHRVAQVKQAYRKLCLLHHPDLSPPDKRLEAERSFKLITEAYSQLHPGSTSRQSSGFSSRSGGRTHAGLSFEQQQRADTLPLGVMRLPCLARMSTSHRWRWCLFRGNSTAQHLQLGQGSPGAELQWARSPRLLPAARAGRRPCGIVRPPTRSPTRKAARYLAALVALSWCRTLLAGLESNCPGAAGIGVGELISAMAPGLTDC